MVLARGVGRGAGLERALPQAVVAAAPSLPPHPPAQARPSQQRFSLQRQRQGLPGVSPPPRLATRKRPAVFLRREKGRERPAGVAVQARRRARVRGAGAAAQQLPVTCRDPGDLP